MDMVVRYADHYAIEYQQSVPVFVMKQRRGNGKKAASPYTHTPMPT